MARGHSCAPQDMWVRFCPQGQQLHAFAYHRPALWSVLKLPRANAAWGPRGPAESLPLFTLSCPTGPGQCLPAGSPGLREGTPPSERSRPCRANVHRCWIRGGQNCSVSLGQRVRTPCSLGRWAEGRLSSPGVEQSFTSRCHFGKSRKEYPLWLVPHPSRFPAFEPLPFSLGTQS